MKIQLL